jgi:hypothetical protein
MPASSGAAITELTPGTTSTGIPAGAHCQDFLTTAPEHEGVAALEADDMLSATRAANHQPMDRVLADGVAVVALADVEPLRATRRLMIAAGTSAS